MSLPRGIAFALPLALVMWALIIGGILAAIATVNGGAL